MLYVGVFQSEVKS